MAWRKWRKEDEDLPEGTKVKVDQHFGNLSGKVGTVDQTAAASSFSIVKIAGKRHSFHNSDLLIKTEVFGEGVNKTKLPLNEDWGQLLGYAGVAIVLGGSLFIKLLDMFGQHTLQNSVAEEGKLKNIVSKVLSKIAPNWYKDKQLNIIAKKLSKVPTVMDFVNHPNKPGIQKEILKYLNEDEQQYLLGLTRGRIKMNKENILKEDAPLIAYNVRIGNKKDGVSLKSVKVTGNSPEEFVRNLKAQLKKEKLGTLSDNAEKTIIKNLQNQLDQLKNLNFAEQKVREAVRKEIKSLLSEAFDLKKVFHDNKRIGLGFTEAELLRNKLRITHAGNMGNSIKDSVNPNLKRLGLPPIEKLKKMYPVIKETGSPDYMYSIEFDIKKNEINESMYEYNNLPEANSYHKVIKPFDIWVYSGSEHRGEHYGNSKIYRGVYKKTKANVGDEIHNLVGGLFYVPKTGRPVEMKTKEPTDRGAFEHGRDWNTFDLKKLQEIPKENAKKVSYR